MTDIRSRMTPKMATGRFMKPSIGSSRSQQTHRMHPQRGRILSQGLLLNFTRVIRVRLCGIGWIWTVLLATRGGATNLRLFPEMT
jgi:hypothetical protein